MQVLANQIEARYLEMNFGNEVKTVTELELVVSEAAAVARTARGRIQSDSGLDPRGFEVLPDPQRRKPYRG